MRKGWGRGGEREWSEENERLLGKISDYLVWGGVQYTIPHPLPICEMVGASTSRGREPGGGSGGLSPPPHFSIRGAEPPQKWRLSKMKNVLNTNSLFKITSYFMNTEPPTFDMLSLPLTKQSLLTPMNILFMIYNMYGRICL